MQVAVPDASVVVKWFVEEEHSTKAARLRDDFLDGRVGLVAPTLLRYEVINALKWSNGFGTAELVRASTAIEDYQLAEVHIEGGYAEETIRIAAEHGLTIYDSAYLALGKVRGLGVLTADDKLLRRAGRVGYLRHIKNYATPKES